MTTMFDDTPTPDRFRVWIGQLRDLLDGSLRALPEFSSEERLRMPASREEMAKHWLADRRDRHRVFGAHADLFHDPSWDIMLDLFVQRGLKRITVSSACLAAQVPPTTALRHLKILQERGLVDRTDNPVDQRSHFVALSEKGLELMNSVLDHSLVRLGA